MAIGIQLRSCSLHYLVLGLLLSLLLLSGCAKLPPNIDRQSSFAHLNTGDTRFGQQINQRIAEMAQDTGHSGVLLLGDGVDAFAARIILAQGAERTIDAQYYMIHADLTGALFTHNLIVAADRGVKVRLLIDDMELCHPLYHGTNVL